MLNIEYLSIESLKPYEKNAKIHTPEQIEQIKSSIEQFGMNDPIGIWSEDNIIVEGHGRLIACKELRFKEVPVIRLDNLSDEERRAYTLIHNQTTMITGFDLDILNQELAEISLDMQEFGFEEIQEPDIEVNEDDFIIKDIEKEPTAKKGDIYQLGNNFLMCGDSTKEEDVKKLMSGNIANLVITDPPYNVNISNSQGMTIENDNMKDEEFKKFLNDAFYNISNSLKEGGAFYIWYGDCQDIAFRTSCFENGLSIKQCLIWVKNHFNLGRQDYQWRHEPCLYGWKEGASHYFIDDRKQSTVIEDKINFESLKKEDAIDLLKQIYEEAISTTIIYEDKPLMNDLHPTMKPIKLIARLIKNSSKENEIILDLFGGSGSTLIACEQLNRKCFIMEYEPKYADVIIERWEAFTGKKARLINEIK